MNIRGTFPKEKIPLQTPFFYGWVIASIAGVGIFFSGPGQTYSISSFVDPLLVHFGWSRSFFSTLYSGGTLIAGLSMVFLGKLVDRFGCRLMLTIVPLLLGITCWYMGAVTGAVTVFIGFVLLRFLGVGSLELIPSVLVAQWFVRMRGRAFWITSMGITVSSASFPYLNVLLIQEWGWPFAFRFWGLVVAAVMAPLAWFLVRNRPEDVGLRTDGDPRPEEGTTSDEKEEISWTLAEAMRTPVFWVIVFAASVPAMVFTGLAFHHMSILTENGLTVEVASLVFTVTAVAQFALLGLAGWTADRFPVRWVFSLTLVLLGASTVLVFPASTPLWATVLGLGRGGAMAFFSITSNVVWPAYFGRRHLASIRGFSMTAMVVLSAFGPMPFGLAYDWFGGYGEILFLMVALSFVSAVLAFFAIPKKKERVIAGL